MENDSLENNRKDQRCTVFQNRTQVFLNNLWAFVDSLYTRDFTQESDLELSDNGKSTVVLQCLI